MVFIRPRRHRYQSVASRIIVAVAVMLISTLGNAAQAEGTVERWAALTPPSFQTVSGPAGLASTVVKAMAQDHDGFIWVGTEGGLARWDGYRFHEYQSISGDPASLPDNVVTKLFVDKKGRLWVGTISGSLARFDSKRDAFVVFSKASGDLSGTRINDIDEDAAGILWVATNGGLFHLPPNASPATGAVKRFGRAEGLLSDSVNALVCDSSGTLWLATSQGLMRREAANQRFDEVRLGDIERPTLGGLLMASNGKLWIAAQKNRLFVLDPRTGTVQTILTPGIPRYLSEPYPGEIWSSAMSGGIIAIDAATFKQRSLKRDPNRPDSLPSDSVNGFLRDGVGALWIATAKGFARYESGRAAQSLKITQELESYSTIFVHRDGTVWLGVKRRQGKYRRS